MDSRFGRASRLKLARKACIFMWFAGSMRRYGSEINVADLDCQMAESFSAISAESSSSVRQPITLSTYVDDATVIPCDDTIDTR